MKIIRFLGGLGNQMFQYALYKALDHRYRNVRADLSAYKIDRSHNGYELEDIFDVKVKKIPPLLSKSFDIHKTRWIYRTIRHTFRLMNYHQAEVQDFVFDPALFSTSKSRYYAGFWQNEQYFASIANEIRNDFRFRPLADQQNMEILNNIQQSDSVSIHVRRGDYVNHPAFGGLCDKAYYQKAVELIQSKIDATRFFVFSNDIDWCKSNIDLPDAEFISWNEGRKSYIDMQLMSKCKHNIIANSSFSWWAAWLNNNPDKMVVGPRKWIHGDYDTSTLLPETWIKL